MNLRSEKHAVKKALANINKDALSIIFEYIGYSSNIIQKKCSGYLLDATLNDDRTLVFMITDKYKYSRNEKLHKLLKSGKKRRYHVAAVDLSGNIAFEYDLDLGERAYIQNYLFHYVKIETHELENQLVVTFEYLTHLFNLKDGTISNKVDGYFSNNPTKINKNIFLFFTYTECVFIDCKKNTLASFDLNEFRYLYSYPYVINIDSNNIYVTYLSQEEIVQKVHKIPQKNIGLLTKSKNKKFSISYEKIPKDFSSDRTKLFNDAVLQINNYRHLINLTI